MRAASLAIGDTRYEVRPPRLDDFAAWRSTRIAHRERLAPAFDGGGDWARQHDRTTWAEQIHRERRAMRRHEALPLVILERDADGTRLVGELGVAGIDPITRSGELSAWAAPVPPEVVPWAAAHLIARVFAAPFSLPRVIAPIAVENGTVDRALQVVGFTARATRRLLRTYRGRPHDHFVWALDNTPHNRAVLDGVRS